MDNKSEQRTSAETSQQKSDTAPIQVEFNKYIWVYEDPANETFSSPSAVVMQKNYQRMKRIRSYSAPQELGQEKAPEPAFHVAKRRRIASINPTLSSDDGGYNSNPSKMDIDYLLD